MFDKIATLLVLRLPTDIDLSLSGPNPSSGYLNAYNSSMPLQVDDQSSLLYQKNLIRICQILGFSDAYPFVKLVRGHTIRTEVYRFECLSNCEDLYLECNSFPIRLDSNGGVEVNFESEWSGLCFSSYISIDIGRVICHKLGLPSYSVSITPDAFYRYRNVYQLSRLSCIDSLPCVDAPQALVRRLCPTFESIKCNTKDDMPEKTDFPLRLFGTDGHSRRVYIKVAGRWGWICKDDITFNDVLIICTQLGFDSGEPSSQLGSTTWTSTGTRWAITTRCEGTEMALSQCRDFSLREARYCITPLFVRCTYKQKHEDVHYPTTTEDDYYPRRGVDYYTTRGVDYISTRGSDTKGNDTFTSVGVVFGIIILSAICILMGLLYRRKQRQDRLRNANGNGTELAPVSNGMGPGEMSQQLRSAQITSSDPSPGLPVSQHTNAPVNNVLGNVASTDEHNLPPKYEDLILDVNLPCYEQLFPSSGPNAAEAL